ncbi:steroid dehydrogenase kik-i, putative [Plasmodium vivax]|uniref:Steroid dehydrogenase kik-i, putative n=1 Tax=Plasmodium vivax (strain Salvador I) TaxID=126793 RepID=A5K658_PLAVS|nr:steroid dehydrogenase kik-i, putative [Plasmodium vivax]EDL45393.1 steroid dehydrogenase kik-i, putative [Plasmodium vivax]|eukprot:XP_001615120.1 steroid dehydrogenase kik-i [Plasmodium vivax Sal-1]
MINYIPPLFVKPLLYIGLVVFLKHALCLVYWLLNCLKCKVFARRLGSYGDTVIITGCTDGIGKSLAYSLISENVNLFLISRNEDALKSMKEDLLQKNRSYKGQIDYAAFDYNANSFTSYRGIQEKIEKLDVGILINNVGASYPHPLYFHEMDVHLVEQLVNVNLLSSYYMTKLVLPGMMRKKKGLILYTSSGAATLQSSPLYAVYASVKEAICSFANSLSVELKEQNIQVQCHVPLFIVTKLSKIRKPSAFVPTADAYAKSAIKRMKQGNSTFSSVISSPYVLHRVQTCLYNAVPKLLFDTMSFMTLKAVRQRALKKARKSD